MLKLKAQKLFEQTSGRQIPDLLEKLVKKLSSLHLNYCESECISHMDNTHIYDNRARYCIQSLLEGYSDSLVEWLGEIKDQNNRLLANTDLSKRHPNKARNSNRIQALTDIDALDWLCQYIQELVNSEDMREVLQEITLLNTRYLPNGTPRPILRRD